jgi:hypothetical protein
MSKFINPGAIEYLYSPLNIKLLLDHARHDVLNRIADKERAGRKRDAEWREYVKYYNIMNEIADRFFNEFDAQGCEGLPPDSKKVDAILFPRLKFGPDN